MGREGGEILGLRVLKSVRSAELESERSRGVSEGPTPEHLFVVFQTCCEALGKCCAPVARQATAPWVECVLIQRCVLSDRMSQSEIAPIP